MRWLLHELEKIISLLTNSKNLLLTKVLKNLSQGHSTTRVPSLSKAFTPSKRQTWNQRKLVSIDFCLVLVHYLGAIQHIHWFCVSDNKNVEPRSLEAYEENGVAKQAHDNLQPLSESNEVVNAVFKSCNISLWVFISVDDIPYSLKHWWNSARKYSKEWWANPSIFCNRLLNFCLYIKAMKDRNIYLIFRVAMGPFDGFHMIIDCGFLPRHKESTHCQIRKSGTALIRMQ